MPKTLISFTALFLLLVICSSVQAQKNVHGTVTDVQTGETLPSTNILIEDTYRGTITNENGSYSLSIPDSLLPATLIVRYIGYQTKSLTITAESASQQDISLEPAVTELEEIVVTDEDPGMQIMREVIRRKQQWRKKLKTYRADAYTRQTLSNDTAIVSISESASEVFWDKEEGHREVQKSKRQTANIQEDQNFAGVSYLPNFYDDNIEISGFNLVGITHPDALDFYNFKLVDQTSLDDQVVFEIEVNPDRKMQPLFMGTALVLADEYALLEVDLKPNDVVTFPPPVKSFSTSYEQQFNNFGGDFWLPVDMRINGDIKIKMVGLNFPQIRFKQLSRITNYKVNTSLPDSLYQQDDLFTVDSTAIESDSLFAKQVTTIPLSLEEEEAYATVDSAATLEEAFKPSGFLADLADDDDASDNGPLNFLGELPGNLMPDGRYNRVDEIFAGLKYNIEPIDWLELRGKGGYSTGYNEWNFGGGLTLQWPGSGTLIPSAGIDYAAETDTRYTSHIYNPYYAIIPNLTGNDGYFDYYRSEGFRAFSEFRYPSKNLSATIGYNSQNHSSLSTSTAYDLFGADNYRNNPSIDAGHLRSVDIVAGYNIDESYNFGIVPQNYIRFEVEHSSDALGSDFEFTRYETRLAWSFPTFYQRRFLPNTLDINLNAGTSTGELPAQKLGIVDVSIGKTSPYGVMKAARGRPYEGEQFLSLNLEHNFRTIPFEAIGLQPLVKQNISLIVFGGAARTWPDWNSKNDKPYSFQPHGTNGIHWEAGISFNGILDLFRIDLATRLDEPAFLINIGVARLF